MKAISSSKWYWTKIVLYTVSLIFVALIAFALIVPIYTPAPNQRDIDLININSCITPATTLVAEKIKKGKKSPLVKAAAPLDASDMCPPLIRTAKLLQSGNIEVEANIALAGVSSGGKNKPPIARREVKIIFIPNPDADKPISWTAQGIPEEAFPRWFLK